MAADERLVLGGHSGALVDLLTSIMAPTEEKSPEDLATLSKAERTAYHQSRLQAENSQAKVGSKAERRFQAHEKQERDRRKKHDIARKAEDDEEALVALKAQGLSEENARTLLAQLEEVEAQKIHSSGATPLDQDGDVEDDESLIDSVRKWMAEHREIASDDNSLRDFNLKVRFQGHTATTPPDHLAAVMQVLAWQCCMELDHAQPLKQPSDMAQVAAPMLARWTLIVGELYNRCDVLDVYDTLAPSLCDGITDALGEIAEDARDVALVGMLMAIRDAFDYMSDEDIVAACHQLDSDSPVLQKFIEFLQVDSDSSDDEGLDST
jgi:hypothetical protein